MNELIARLEAASEGSRELDVRIHAALHPGRSLLLDPGSVGPKRREPQYGTLSDLPLDGWSDYEAVARTIDAPAYTTSLDAALTLVPAGWGWSLDYMDPGEPDGAMVGQHAGEGYNADCRPVPPALALCIAALKARAA
jgi:hypothetical protein